MAKRITIITFLALVALVTPLYGQDVYQAYRAQWLAKAKQYIPPLKETIKQPVSTVALVKNPTAFQGWEAKKTDSLDVFYNESFQKRKTVILDFGEHLTGYVSFDLKVLTGTADAPSRFKLTFGEVPIRNCHTI